MRAAVFVFFLKNPAAEIVFICSSVQIYIKQNNMERRRKSILRDPGAVCRVERKGAKSTGGRALQKLKLLLAADWAPKSFLLCPIGSDFRVFVNQCCAYKGNFHITCTSLARDENITDDSGKHFGCYQQQHSNLHWETFFAPFPSARLTVPGSPRMKMKKK